jgi:hypothetical protein
VCSDTHHSSIAYPGERQSGSLLPLTRRSSSTSVDDNQLERLRKRLSIPAETSIRILLLLDLQNLIPDFQRVLSGISMACMNTRGSTEYVDLGWTVPTACPTLLTPKMLWIDGTLK